MKSYHERDFATACQELALRAKPAILAYPISLFCIILLGPYFRSHPKVSGTLTICILVATVVRWRHCNRILAITGPVSPRLKRQFDVMAIVSALGWGLLGVYAAAFASSNDLILLYLATVTMGAGAISSMATDSRLYRGYVYCLAIPNALYFLIRGDFQSSTVGIMGLVLATVASYLNWTLCRSYWTNLRLNRERVEEITSARERLEMVVSGSNLGTFDWRLDTRQFFLDRKAPESLGFPPERFDPLEGNGYELLEPEDAVAVRQQLVRLLKCPDRETYEVEVRLRAQDGHFRWFNFRGRVVQHDLAGRAERVAGTYQDITQRKQSELRLAELQQRVEQAEKLKTLGVLAGGVAHDFNNLLTAFVGNIELARLEIDETSGAQELLDEARRAALNASELCNQLLAYAGRARCRVEQFDLNSLVREMTHLLQVSVGKEHEFLVDLNDQLPQVRADKGQIRQVILNLMTNAAESMEEQTGTITLKTDTVDAAQLKSIHPDLKAGEYVRLTVRDEGCGMSTEVLTKMFDPFFTTKFTGRGLGLASVLGIARGHEGKIFAESEIGEGTEVHLLLPACPQRQTVPTVQGQPEEYRAALMRVLVVDDEASVRGLLKKLLSRLGHTVLEASDGVEALERLSGTEVDLVILDMIMPRKDGFATLTEIRESWPELPVLLSSGYSEEAVLNKAKEQVQGFLKKPYDLEQLMRALQALHRGESFLVHSSPL